MSAYGWGHAAGLLDTGYPRDAPYWDLVRARDLLLEARGASGAEEDEDAPADVADFLDGFCAGCVSPRAVHSRGFTRGAPPQDLLPLGKALEHRKSRFRPGHV
jgi:hypothetical protein